MSPASLGWIEIADPIILVYMQAVADTRHTAFLPRSPLKKANMPTSEILQILAQYKRDNSRKYGISNIGIFGSCFAGHATDESDIDVVVPQDDP